jgi:hypothetical protein
MLEGTPTFTFPGRASWERSIKHHEAVLASATRTPDPAEVEWRQGRIKELRAALASFDRGGLTESAMRAANL